MSRLLRALAAGIVLLGCAGCSGDPGGDDAGAGSTTSVAAVPDPPYVEGPIRVRLAPALTMPASAPCAPVPADRIVCSPELSHTYKLLGPSPVATIVEVGTAPSDDHTSWTTTVLFDRASRGAVRVAARQAAGFGGLVLVLSGGRVLDAVAPPDFGPRKAEFLGLEKPEAWALVDAFRP